MPMTFLPQNNPNQPKHYYEREGYIYFAYDDYAIKIGFSFDPESRVRNLQNACSVPLVLLWKMKGTILQEQELHRLFGHLKIKGEWFEDNGEIKEFIEQQKPQPPQKKIVRPASDIEFIALLKRRPRVALRRVTDQRARLAVKEYILNRGTMAEAASLENASQVKWGG